MGMRLGTSPFPPHTLTREEEALQCTEAALPSRNVVAEPEAYVNGKGIFHFGLAFFHGYKNLNYLTAILMKELFLVKNDSRY